MTPATSKFAFDIVNHVLRLYTSEKNRCFVESASEVSNPPILYNYFGKYLVEQYLTKHKENIEIFCSSIFEKSKLTRHYYRNRADSMIELSRQYDQSCHFFYNMCIKLSLLGFVAMKKGIADALAYAVEKIEILAAEAYTRGDLDEKLDCMFNFAYDLLYAVLSWSGCNFDLHWDLKRLNLDSNAFDYYKFYSSYFQNFFSRNGNTILHKFRAVGLKQKIMTREIFIFQIQDWCDAYYGQLGAVEPVKSLSNLLESLANISLLTVHAVGLFYTCSIRLAFESILKLAISAERHGLWSSDNQEKLRTKALMEF